MLPGQTSSVMPRSTTSASTVGSSTDRTPWPIRSGSRLSSVVRTCPGPSSSPLCGTDSKPAPRAMRKAPANSLVSPRLSSLLRPKPMTSPGPSPAWCTASRARVRASKRVPHPAGRHDQRDADSRCGRGVSGGVLDQLEGRGEPTEMHRVRRRVDLELEPARAVAGVVLGRLQHEPAHVRLVADTRPGDVIEPLEPEPALLVGRVQLRGLPAVSASGRCTPCRRARSSRVAGRMEPVKCRCRWALGSRVRSRND